ncbi:D-alanyl-D-alanine carboxypeptidase [Herbihabitans rhizosphaerae]|uniref:D-alanyl-D-alanine carboxypeptidase n=1 Tax=Herbihabitans rhizosphaerae TaxID=1872711 RepID=A0A4Q7KGG3_9PSEU|nr:serine hydrolase domain-containing protein [Herbihabitans rhizosphaerae]RZS33938.1 D-alanyl-D-alanine carboxypeptidase [Herbihabitans rhizosphaerae]
MFRQSTKRVAFAATAIAVATVAAIVPWSAQADGRADDHSDTLRVLIGHHNHAGPGAVVVAGNGAGPWHLWAGAGNVPQNKPIGPADRIRIASQTKTMTAAIVLQLVGEGKIDLDSPIERYLPGLVQGNGYDGNKISVRQILQQTAGLAEFVKGGDSINRTYTLEQLVRAGLSNPPAFAPGTSWGYSNTNYAVAGMLVERITGTSVNAAIADRITVPLGLSQTRLPAPGDHTIGAPATHGYSGFQNGSIFFWQDVSNSFEPSYLSSAGGVVSTPEDMAKFVSALVAGKVVPQAQLAEMRKIVPTPYWDGYGLGLTRLELPCGGEAWGHYGDWLGYSSGTMATADGRYASMVTNTRVATALPEGSTRDNVLESALCGSG